MKPDTRWKKRSEKIAPQEKDWWEQEDDDTIQIVK